VAIPAGTNTSISWEGKPPTILTPGTPGFVPGTPGFTSAIFLGPEMYHKFEIQFLDFQMNQTAPFASNLVQNIEIYFNQTFGVHKGFFNGDNFTEGETFTSDIPDSTTGYNQIFSGLYNGGPDNKINIDKTYTYDVCGLNYEKGWFDVWIRPLNGATEGSFREGYYTCFWNLTVDTSIVHEGESRWSPIFQCNSGSLNNYSFRLWYQIRFYNIEPKTCNPNGFVTN